MWEGFKKVKCCIWFYLLSLFFKLYCSYWTENEWKKQPKFKRKTVKTCWKEKIKIKMDIKSICFLLFHLSFKWINISSFLYYRCLKIASSLFLYNVSLMKVNELYFCQIHWYFFQTCWQLFGFPRVVNAVRVIPCVKLLSNHCPLLWTRSQDFLNSGRVTCFALVGQCVTVKQHVRRLRHLLLLRNVSKTMQSQSASSLFPSRWATAPSPGETTSWPCQTSAYASPQVSLRFCFKN